MPSDPKANVHRLHVSEDAFRMMAEGIAALSIHRQKFETLASVLEYGIVHGITLKDDELVKFLNTKVEGDVRVFLRVPRALLPTFEGHRSNLERSTSRIWQVRDVVTYACYSATRAFSGLP